MEIPIYNNNIPNINEHVLVIFTKHVNESHFEAELQEYKNIKGIMIYSDATKKKKIYNWNQIIPLNKLRVARVEEIFDNENVKLSIACFDNRTNNEELMKPFHDNKVLINIIKKLCRQNNINFNDFWIKIIYPLDISRKNEDNNESLFDTFNNNLELVNKLIKDNYGIENIIFENKSDKKYVNAYLSLSSKTGVNNIINLLNLAKENRPFEFNVKYITIKNQKIKSNFLLTSSSQENNEIFIQFIEENINKYNVIFSLIS